MKSEVDFVKIHYPIWKDFDSIMSSQAKIDPDRLAQYYTKVTEDLSYLNTFYPDSRYLSYLNNLSNRAHHAIYKNKKENKNRFILFWKDELPIVVQECKGEIYLSTIIFLVAIAIGFFSTLHNDEYVRLIMGDQYVNMTLNNIEKGDPMAVYKGHAEGSMFFMLSVNNIRVSFLAFVFGIFGPFMTGMLLFFNGIMVGAFICFFKVKGMFNLAFSTIMIHGTLELSAIVMAGAAGMVIGNGWLFPGTYKRKDALRLSGNRALKLVMGIVPVFIIAAILESHVTRHYLALGNIGRWAIVILTGALFVWYFFIYPTKVKQKYEHT